MCGNQSRENSVLYFTYSFSSPFLFSFDKERSNDHGESFRRPVERASPVVGMSFLSPRNGDAEVILEFGSAAFIAVEIVIIFVLPLDSADLPSTFIFLNHT